MILKQVLYFLYHHHYYFHFYHLHHHHHLYIIIMSVMCGDVWGCGLNNVDLFQVIGTYVIIIFSYRTT